MPGLGLCLPERLGEGWLVRPDQRAVRLTARLRTSTAGAVLEVSGAAEPVAAGAPRSPPGTPRSCGCWRDAGPDGLSAAALSRALFGDDEHVVTVRAEVSRLRRVVGAIVGTAPYRVADGVRLVCED